MFDPNVPIRRLMSRDLSSLAAYRIYQTQLLFWAPEDPNFCVNEAVANLTGLPADAAVLDEEDSDNGVFVYSDSEIVINDIRDDLCARTHSSGDIEVRYFRTESDPDGRSAKCQVWPYLSYDGDRGPGFSVSMQAGQPILSKDLATCKVAFRPSSAVLRDNTDVKD